jgi:hypothetical protein
MFLICPTEHSGSRYCFGLREKGGSESKKRRPEFLSSQVSNPTLNEGGEKRMMNSNVCERNMS